MSPILKQRIADVLSDLATESRGEVESNLYSLLPTNDDVADMVEQAIQTQIDYASEQIGVALEALTGGREDEANAALRVAVLLAVSEYESAGGVPYPSKARWGESLVLVWQDFVRAAWAQSKEQ